MLEVDVQIRSTVGFARHTLRQVTKPEGNKLSLIRSRVRTPNDTA